MKLHKGWVAYFALCVMLLLSTPAKAYLDPSITTYIIQAVAGVAIAVGAVVAVIWNKTRKKMREKLHIDDNARKEVEDDVVVTDAPEAAQTDAPETK